VLGYNFVLPKFFYPRWQFRPVLHTPPWLQLHNCKCKKLLFSRWTSGWEPECDLRAGRSALVVIVLSSD